MLRLRPQKKKPPENSDGFSCFRAFPERFSFGRIYGAGFESIRGWVQFKRDFLSLDESFESVLFDGSVVHVDVLIVPWLANDSPAPVVVKVGDRSFRHSDLLLRVRVAVNRASVSYTYETKIGSQS